MQKTIHLNWVSGELVLWGIFTSNFLFFFLEFENLPDDTCDQPDQNAHAAATWAPFSCLCAGLSAQLSFQPPQEGRNLVLLGFVFSHHECNLWALLSSAQLSSWVSARAELTVYSLRPGASVVHFKAVNTDHRRGRRHPRPPASKQHKDGGSLRITHLTTQFFFFLMLLLKKKKFILFKYSWCCINFCCTAKGFSYQFSSVAQSCPTLFNPMDCSTPGLPVCHQLLELAQTHVHGVSDAIQPSHPLLRIQWYIFIFFSITI